MCIHLSVFIVRTAWINKYENKWNTSPNVFPASQWPISAADLWYFVLNYFPSCLLPQLRLSLPRWVTFSGWQRPFYVGWRETPGRTRVCSARVMAGKVSNTLGWSTATSTCPALRYSPGTFLNVLESNVRCETSFWTINSSHQWLWLNQKVFPSNPVRKTLFQSPSKACCLSEAGKNVLLSHAAGDPGAGGGCFPQTTCRVQLLV